MVTLSEISGLAASTLRLTFTGLSIDYYNYILHNMYTTDRPHQRLSTA